MLRVIAFGLAAGAGVQAWRNFPPDGPVSGDMLAWVFMGGVIAAYLGGRWFGRSSGARATATATATATAGAVASNQVNVAVFVPGGGARPSGVVVPSDVSWQGEARPQITADDLDGLDLSDVFESAGETESSG